MLGIILSFHNQIMNKYINSLKLFSIKRMPNNHNAYLKTNNNLFNYFSNKFAKLKLNPKEKETIIKKNNKYLLFFPVVQSLHLINKDITTEKLYITSSDINNNPIEFDIEINTKIINDLKYISVPNIYENYLKVITNNIHNNMKINNYKLVDLLNKNNNFLFYNAINTINSENIINISINILAISINGIENTDKYIILKKQLNDLKAMIPDMFGKLCGYIILFFFVQIYIEDFL